MAIVTEKFECGCEVERKYDARFAREKSIVRIAKARGGEVNFTGQCPDCKKNAVRDAINDLSEQEARALLHSLSTFGELRRKLGINSNSLKD